MRRKKCVEGSGPQPQSICATYRLKDLLKLGNNPILFRNLKRQLYRVAEKHMDINDPPRQEFAAIEAELVSTLPDIFDLTGPGKIRLQLAFQIMASYHYRRRFHSKHQIQSSEPSPKKHSLLMSVSMPTRAALQKERKEGKKRKEYEIIDLTDCKYDEKVEFVKPQLPQMIEISDLPIKKASPPTISPLTFISSPTAGPSILQSRTAHIQSLFDAESSSHDDAFQLTDVTRVARFLNACFPPMAHFLRHFIDFGCTGEEYLVAVSTWPSEKISHFLSQVSAYGSNERRFSDMDMLILHNHFISYFIKART